MTSTSRHEYHILAAILLLALFLRVWGLNTPLWYDEILTVETHLRLPWGDMMQSYSMNHHYLFSLQSKASFALFGEAPWSARLPAMIFGVASIAAIWWLARDLAGRNIAHITALLLAISFHHIWFSQNARGYSELAFWCAAGAILFRNGLHRPTFRVWIGYSICLSLAVFTHLTGVFFFAAQGLVWLFIAIRAGFADGLRSPVVTLPLLGYIVGGVLTLIFYAPILPSVIAVTSTVSEGSAVNVMQEYENPLWTVIEAVRTVVGNLGPFVGVIAVFAITLVCLGSLSLWPQDKSFAPTILLHIVLTMALLVALGMRVWPRFFFVDIGFLMLLIVLGVRFLIDISARLVPAIPTKPLFMVAVVMMVLISVGLATRNYTSPKQDLFGAFELVEDQRTDRDQVYAIGISAGVVFNDHYGADWGEIKKPEQFTSALALPGPAYFVVMFPARYVRVIPELETLMKDGTLELIKSFPGTLGDGAVLVLKRN